MKLVWIILAFTTGLFLPIQAGLNARLSKSLNSPLHATMISFLIGAIAVMFYIFFARQQVSWTGIKAAPCYVWIGGMLGAFYVAVVVLAFPRIGPALTFGFVVAGQMLMSVLLGHFNLLVAQQHNINGWKA